jgi:N-acetylneuraminic acid mutarotase
MDRSEILSILIFLILSAATCQPNWDWKIVPNYNSPSNLVGHTAVQNVNSAYIFGGQTSSSFSNKSDDFSYPNNVWQYDLGVDYWFNLDPSGGPNGRIGHGAIATSYQMFIYGGYATSNEGTTSFDDFWIFDLSQRYWTEVNCPNGPGFRSNFGFAYSNETIYIFGGSDNKGNQYSDLWSYSIKYNNWQLIPTSNGPSARQDLFLSSFDFGLVLFGGLNEDGKLLNDLWIFQDGSWKSTDQKASPPPRQYFAGTIVGNYLVIESGLTSSNEVLADTWVYDSNHNEWLSLNMISPGVIESTMVFYYGSLFLILGQSSPNQWNNEVYMFQFPFPL